MRQRSIAGCYQNNVAWLYKKNSTSSESRRKRPAGISTKKTTV
ncbi:hypothetical protein [Symbiopectobacterium purcellii]